MAHLYYLDGQPLAAGAEVSMTGVEAKHAAQVARIRTGETVLVGDGMGVLAEARITSVDARRPRVELSVEHLLAPQPTLRPITLVQALAKQGRDESAIQMATELGASAVQPWQAQRSIVKWDEQKRSRSEDRWRTIVREASKQSIRASVPEVHPLALAATDIAVDATGTLVLLDPRSAHTIGDVVTTSNAPITLVVGPEGGISDAERGHLIERGAVAVGLGHLVLRTSTAGAAAIAAIRAIAGDWQPARE